MKKFAMLLIFAICILVVASVFAQDEDTTTDDSEETIVIVVPDILVVCPGQGALRSVREAAELVLQFGSVTGTWIVPYGVVTETEEGRLIEIGQMELNCDSSAGEVATIDRSPPVDLNEPPPEPENPIGVAETQVGHLIVITGPANLRSCDHPTCSQVAVVHGGDALVALGRNADASWWYVQADDVHGWIWNDLVAIRGDLTGIPVIETDGEPTVPRVYIGYTGNPIYDELSAAGQVICQIQGGLEYPLLGRTSDDSWVWIEALCLDGTVVQGWVDARYVAIRNTGHVYVPVVGPEGP